MKATEVLHEPGQSLSLDVHGLAAPFTINTMPDTNDHGEVGEPLPVDGGDADAILARFAEAGVDVDRLAERLQREGAESFVAAWKELMDRIGAQASTLA